MSRSKRKPAFFIGCWANPRKGKMLTSRSIRRIVRQKVKTNGDDDFDFDHPLDKNRGNGGSRDPDWGWNFFGDGKHNPYRIELWVAKKNNGEDDIEWLNKLKRK